MNKTRQIRELARQLRNVADDPLQEYRRHMWASLNQLRYVWPTPVLLAIDLPAWREILPPDCLGAADPVYRRVEMELRKQLWYASLNSDMVIEPWITMNATYYDDSLSMWGVEAQYSEIGGSTVFNGEIEHPADLDRMHVHCLHLDGTRTLEAYDRTRELLQDIIGVRMEWRHRHLVQPNFGVWTIQFVGLQRFLEWCIDYPDAVHRLMRIIYETFIQHNLDMERRGRLTDNHCFLPDFYPWHGPTVEYPMLRDMWVHTESQDFQGISPEMLNEYLFTYLRPACEMFGQVSFGCCESLNGKLHIVKTLPNLRRVTISERTDWRYAIDTLGADYVYSVRPVLVDTVYIDDEAQQRKKIAHMAQTFEGLPWEINFPGALTFNGDEQRFHKWVRLAQEEVRR